MENPTFDRRDYNQIIGTFDDIVIKDTELAVDINSVEYEYRTNVKVLDKLSLKIPKGEIFALLGPNGVGKTTLIRSILGRLQLRKGTIKVFGVRPGSKYSDIPGQGVGYMPQELALFEEFTISEILTYYGSIYSIQTEELKQRIDNLIQLLHLPEKTRPISRLSGGQQRRVSIAITMIHKPKLIILDEPTVGVDSLLRHRIWQYLQQICRENGQTVIITTHYIEEARNAYTVAFMNYGTILKQSNPQQMLREFNCETLEEVFLILCNKRIKNTNNNEISSDQRCQDELTELDYDSTTDCSIIPDKISQFPYKKKYFYKNIINFNHIIAMLLKYYILTVRRPFFVVLFYTIPIIILIYLKYFIGSNPNNISIAVYNEDQNPEYSGLFIKSIDRNYVEVNKYQTNESAIESVKDGNNFMSIVFGANFSENFEARWLYPHEMTEEELEESEIKLYVDFSNIAIGVFIYKNIVYAFKTLLEDLSSKFGLNLVNYMHPIIVEDVVYGTIDFNLGVHFGPGLMLCAIHLLPMILSGFQITNDRENASFERVFVAGVKPIELFVAHLIMNIVILVPQVIMTMIGAFYIFDFDQFGSYLEVFSIMVLQGIQGISIGLAIALVMSDIASVGLGIASFMLPFWILSGVLWPVESVPDYFRYFTDSSPLTQPLLAFRAVMLRGWDFTRPTVYFGYIVSIGYTLLFFVFDIILFNKFTDKAISFFNKR